MAINNATNNEKPHTVQHIQNMGFDRTRQMPMVEQAVVNPATGLPELVTTIDPAQTITEDASSTVTYVGMNSSLSAATSDTTWIIQKIDTSNGTVIKKTVGSWDNRASLF